MSEDELQPVRLITNLPKDHSLMEILISQIRAFALLLDQFGRFVLVTVEINHNSTNKSEFEDLKIN